MSEITPTPPSVGQPLEDEAPPKHSEASPSLMEELLTDAKKMGGWFSDNRAATLFLLGIGAIIFYFFGVFSPYVNGSITAFRWAHEAWNGSQEFGRLVPLIALVLVIIKRRELARLKEEGSSWGLGIVLLGLFIYFVSVRTVQPRFALACIPFLIFGSVLFTSGFKAARLVLFPCAFLFFMIPVAALEQATFDLQFIITRVVGALSKLIGIGIESMGTNLIASNGQFRFEVAEGCSGINSLTSMTMLTAAYVHLTQDRQWKKAVIFLCSLLFAIIGNIGRIFTIILVARFYDSDFATGLYHDWSGFFFFPIAVMAMLGFAKLLNWNKGSRKGPGEAAATA